MVNARQIIERYVGPSAEETEAVVRTVKASKTWQQANDALADYPIRFTDSEPTLNKTGAPGGYSPEDEMVLLNASWFPRFQWNSTDLRTTIEHELTHQGQFARAKERGADPEELGRSQERHLLDKSGNIRMDRYQRQPHEMQALARNAVSGAKRVRQDMGKALRRGDIADYSPRAPGDRKRFLKYAYQMSQESLPPLTKLIKEHAMLLVAAMLNEAVTRACAWCEAEYGPVKAQPGTAISHGYCKRHMLQAAIESGSPEFAEQVRRQDDSVYAPDLAKHPELIDREPAQTAAAGQAAVHQAQGAHLARR